MYTVWKSNLRDITRQSKQAIPQSHEHSRIIFINGPIQTFHMFDYKLEFSLKKNKNLHERHLPGNIADVDKRKIYTFPFGNQIQNMSGLPTSRSNKRMTAPGRKWHACRSWASQATADLPKTGPASKNNITHGSLYVRSGLKSSGWQQLLPLIISTNFKKILNPLMPFLIAKTTNKSQAYPQ